MLVDEADSMDDVMVWFPHYSLCNGLRNIYANYDYENSILCNKTTGMYAIFFFCYFILEERWPEIVFFEICSDTDFSIFNFHQFKPNSKIDFDQKSV